MAWRAASREVKSYLYSRRLGEALKNEKKSPNSQTSCEVNVCLQLMLTYWLCRCSTYIYIMWFGFDPYIYIKLTSEVSNTKSKMCVFAVASLIFFFQLLQDRKQKTVCL